MNAAHGLPGPGPAMPGRGALASGWARHRRKAVAAAVGTGALLAAIGWMHTPAGLKLLATGVGVD